MPIYNSTGGLENITKNDCLIVLLWLNLKSGDHLGMVLNYSA